MKLRRALSGLCGEMAEFCRVTERNGAVCDGKEENLLKREKRVKVLFSCTLRFKCKQSLPVICRPNGEFKK